jgi:hypothetical protein
MTAQPFKTLVLDFLQQGRLNAAAFVQGLTETERTAVGSPECWSAKDHLAHRTFWHRDLIKKLTAGPQDQPSPEGEQDEDELNDRVLEANKLRPWADVYAEAEQTYADLIKLAERLSEEELTATGRYPWLSAEWPLYTAFLGNCYDHDQEHLAQYYLDHDNLPRAIEIREQCISRIFQGDLPDRMKGGFLYNLVCFYAKQNQLAKAADRLPEALTLAPHLEEWSQRDPDLAALRS